MKSLTPEMIHIEFLPRLQAVLEQLTSITRSHQEPGTSGETSGDSADQARDHQQNHSSEILNRELHFLEKEVHAALKRIEAGIYGICENCEDPIGLARLKTLPYASHCVACQRDIERERGRLAS